MSPPWPTTPPELMRLQHEIARLTPAPLRPASVRRLRVGGVFICFAPQPHGSGEIGWAAAVLTDGRRALASSIATGPVTAPYIAGLLALREGPLLAVAVDRLPELPDVLLVNATGRDHPRRAGLAVHLGWALDVPTVGVTDRPLLATASPPDDERGDSSPLLLDDDIVGYCVRSRANARPVVVHAGWRVDPDSAKAVAVRCLRRARTPEPLRRARKMARLARAGVTAETTPTFYS